MTGSKMRRLPPRARVTCDIWHLNVVKLSVTLKQRSDLSEWLQKEGVTSVPRAIQCKQREEALAASRAAANAPDAPAPPSTSTLLGVAAQFDGSGVSKGQ